MLQNVLFIFSQCSQGLHESDKTFMLHAVDTIADFRVTAGTPFYSLIYTLQSRDLDTRKAFDTSGVNDQLIHLIYNGVKSPFEKIIYLF